MWFAECRLLSELGARPGGRVHVVVTDLREELVAYVNGSPYLRRELEMPSAALHHAGASPPSPPNPPPPLPLWPHNFVPCLLG